MAKGSVKITDAELLKADADFKVASAWYWAKGYKIKLPGGVYQNKGHEFLQEVMDDQSRRQCAMKAPQFAGFTVALILRALHDMIYGFLPQGVLYMLPTRDEVSDCSDSKFKPIIEGNPEIIGKYVTSTDRTGLKRVKDGYLYFRGANLTQRTEANEYRTSRIKNFSVDQFVLDEFDEMPKEARGLALGRMEHSHIQRELYLANATFPGYGIDGLFYQESDQRYWEIFCRACGKFTNMELSFPDCLKRQVDGSVIRACVNCGKEIFPKDGKWIPQYPQKSKDMVGRRISHLSSSFKDPKIILDAWEDPEKMKLYYETETMFYRHCLATGHFDADAMLRKEDVWRCCGMDMNGTKPYTGSGFTPKPCAMGMDYKKHAINIVIGYPIPDKRSYKVVYVARVASFEEAHDIAKQYNVVSGMGDAQSEPHKIKEFQKAQGYKFFLCDYRENLKLGEKIDDDEGVFTVRKTIALDFSHRVVMDLGRLEIPRRGPEVDVFAHQMCRTAKEVVEDKKTGMIQPRYKKLGDDDDYRHAFTYFLYACEDVALKARALQARARRLGVDTDYERNHSYNPLKRFLRNAA